MKKILLYIFFALALILFVVLRFVEESSSGAEIAWPFIITVFGISILWALPVIFLQRKCVKEFNRKNYRYVLKHKKLPAFFTTSTPQKDRLHYMIAIASLETGDEAGFLDYINRIQNQDVTNRKYFWLAVYSIMQNNIAEYQHWYGYLFYNPNHTEQEYYVKLLNLLYQNRIENKPLTEEDKQLIANINSDRLEQLFCMAM